MIARRNSLGEVVSVVPSSALDFPDGAQRFNWCNCQPSVQTALAGLGYSAAPASSTPGADSIPLFDFGFWSQQLNGGPLPTTSGSGLSGLGLMALVAAGALLVWMVSGRQALAGREDSSAPRRGRRR